MKDVESSAITEVDYCETASYLYGESISKQLAVSLWSYEGQSAQCYISIHI